MGSVRFANSASTSSSQMLTLDPLMTCIWYACSYKLLLKIKHKTAKHTFTFAPTVYEGTSESSGKWSQKFIFVWKKNFEIYAQFLYCKFFINLRQFICMDFKIFCTKKTLFLNSIFPWSFDVQYLRWNSFVISRYL